MAFVQAQQEAAELRSQLVLQRQGLRRDDVDLQAPGPQRGRGLKADEARADHGGGTCARRGGDHRVAVGLAAQHEHVVALEPRRVRPVGLGAGGQQQGVVVQRRAIAQREPFARRGRSARPLVESRRSIRCSAIEGVVLQRHPGRVRLAGEIVLGKVRPVVGRQRIGAQQRQLARIAEIAQPLGRREPRRPAADDDDRLRVARRRSLGRVRRRQLLAHERLAVRHLDFPAIDRRQGRRLERRAGAQVEAGVVPGASQRRPDLQAVLQRAAVVAAGAADRDQLAINPGQHHRLVADVAADDAVVGNFAKLQPLGEIGAARGVGIRHGSLRPSSPHWRTRQDSNL